MILIIVNNLLNYWLMLLVTLIYGCCCAFYYPAILTSVNDIINDPQILSNGISIINSTNRIMMFLGYGLGGLLINHFGELSSFYFNSITFLFSFFLLALCRSITMAIPILFLLDFCLMVTLTTGIIFIQQIVAKEYLGRLMGIISMASFGMVPLGSIMFYGSLYFAVKCPLVFQTITRNTALCSPNSNC